MTLGGFIGWHWAAAGQATLVALVLFVIAFAPPPHGRTLLVPVSGETISPALLGKLMLTPLSPGPLPGSVVVEGKGRELAKPLFDEGILMLAAPAAICRVPDEAGSKA